MFQVRKGWPVGLGGLFEHSIEPPAAVLANIDHEGTALCLENGVWALADATDVTLAKQVATPVADTQAWASLAFTVDRAIEDDSGNPGYDVGYTGLVPVVQGDFLAWIDDEVFTGALAAGQYLTISATDGQLAAASAASDVPVCGLVLREVQANLANFQGTAWEVRFFTPKFLTIA